MILLIDNYDSFVYNLARYVTELRETPNVARNDALTLTDITLMAPTHIILSPGPCTPSEAGLCLDIVKTFGETIPILGVCLGHQVIGQAYGARIVRATQPMHGKPDRVVHHGKGIFKHIDNPLNVGRYHSLIVDHQDFPSCLQRIAHNKENEIMAICHKSFPVFGVQFHPESVLTDCGHNLLKNFLAL